MFPDYRKLVHQDYQKKVAAGVLSSRLSQPTPANLRDECIAVCMERPDKKDDQILRTFFGPFGDIAACIRTIEKFDTGKFKPLINYLRNPAINTDVKNLDLLAWLTDFQPRPFDLGKNYDTAKPERQDTPGESLSEEEGSAEEPELFPTDEKLSGKPEQKSRMKVIILAVMMVMFIGTAIYWISEQKAPSIVFTGYGGCMYWADDHYEPISCRKHGDTLVVPLDSEMIVHFRKITRPDTITARSMGAVWYVKVNGTLEYYTWSGFHPTATWLRLRPITGYMINKYILTNN